MSRVMCDRGGSESSMMYAGCGTDTKTGPGVRGGRVKNAQLFFESNQERQN